MKIKVKSVTLTFTESNRFQCPKTFESMAAVDAFLQHENRAADGMLGYYKTDFTVLFEDDTEYKGRFDIGSDYYNLSQHIINFVEIHSGTKKLARMTAEQWESFKTRIAEHIPFYKNIQDNYTLDSTTKLNV